MFVSQPVFLLSENYFIGYMNKTYVFFRQFWSVPKNRGKTETVKHTASEHSSPDKLSLGYQCLFVNDIKIIKHKWLLNELKNFDDKQPGYKFSLSFFKLFYHKLLY